MKIKVHRETLNDPESINISDIIRDTNAVLKPEIDEVRSLLETLPTEARVDELIESKVSEIDLLNEGVFDLNAPISIASTQKVEELHNRQGLLYFDIINQRLRICTKDGWKTVKL